MVEMAKFDVQPVPAFIELHKTLQRKKKEIITSKTAMLAFGRAVNEVSHWCQMLVYGASESGRGKSEEGKFV